LLIAFGVVLIWQGYIGCIDSLEYEEQAYTIAIPYWPFYLVMVFSGILITTQQVGSFLVACSAPKIKPEGRSL
jgi:TRAP-type C4-dicarboxylate transport system permease small subunit